MLICGTMLTVFSRRMTTTAASTAVDCGSPPRAGPTLPVRWYTALSSPNLLAVTESRRRASCPPPEVVAVQCRQSSSADRYAAYRSCATCADGKTPIASLMNLFDALNVADRDAIESAVGSAA